MVTYPCLTLIVQFSNFSLNKAKLNSEPVINGECVLVDPGISGL